MSMRFDRFTERAQDVAARSYRIVQSYNHTQVDTEHMLLALLEQNDGTVPRLIADIGADINAMMTRMDEELRTMPRAATYGGGVGQIFYTPRIRTVLETASNEANKLKDEFIATEHIFLAILAEKNTASARILREFKITRPLVIKSLEVLREGNQIATRDEESLSRTLEKFSTNLTKLAKENSLDPVVERQPELDRIAQILSQRNRNNPLLVGERGVGKTAIINGLAQRIVKGSVPEIFQRKTIIVPDVFFFVAGALIGELEKRIQVLVAELYHTQGEFILFLDDLQEFTTQETAVVLGVLQSAINRNNIQVIGATTVEGYERFFKSHALFNRSYMPVFIREFSVEQTIKVLEAIKPTYELHHGLTIAKEAIEVAARLSDRFLRELYQPQKSILVVDEASTALKFQLSNLPGDLVEQKQQIEELKHQEETVHKNREYAEAARIRAKRLRLESDWIILQDQWALEKGLSSTVTEKDVFKVISRMTGKKIEELTGTPIVEDVLEHTINSVSSEELRLGERFNYKYEVMSRISLGPFSEVWRVRDRKLEREVAIKLLPYGFDNRSKYIQRVENEARIIANLKHPNIVTIYEFEEGASRYYIAMEYIPGSSLDSIINPEKPMPFRKAHSIIAQVCKALAFAHEKGVIHQDIKPSNILLSGEQVKVVDFGISVLVKEAATEATGAWGATLAYRAPEQSRGEKSDQRSDIYSLGITLYELLVGKLPFRGIGQEMIWQHQGKLPEHPCSINWNLPPGVDKIILKCLEKDPDKRYQTVLEMIDDWMNLKGELQRDDLISLRELLLSRCSEVEIKDLCFDLEINYEDLSGISRPEKITELVKHCERHNKIFALVNRLKKRRPDIEDLF